MISIFAILVGFFDAVMDRTNEEVAFNNSIFRNLNQKWWLRSVSWRYTGFLPLLKKYRLDAWHLAKTCKTACTGMMAAYGFSMAYFQKYPLWNLVLSGAFMAVLVTLSFVFFYDIVLKKKTKK
jgi:hypothetical protein